MGLPAKLMRLTRKLLGDKLTGLRNLTQHLRVLADRLLIRLGRSVHALALEPAVVLIRHLQMFARELVKDVARRLGRLGSAPDGGDGHPLALFQTLTGYQDIGALDPGVRALHGLSARA